MSGDCAGLRSIRRKVPVIADQYTEDQIDAFQIKMIVDDLVRRNSRYTEIVKNKVYQKRAT